VGVDQRRAFEPRFEVEVAGAELSERRRIFKVLLDQKMNPGFVRRFARPPVFGAGIYSQREVRRGTARRSHDDVLGAVGADERLG